VATAVVGAISALVGLNAGLSAHEEALFRAAGAARSYADAMAAAASQADAARDSARKAATDISTLNLKIAEASGDEAAIAAAKDAKVFADSADARIAKGAEFTKALEDEAQAQADVDKAAAGMAKARADIAKVEAHMSLRRLHRIDFENEALQLEKLVLLQTFDSFEDASFDAGKRLVAMSEQVDALEVVLDRLDALDEAQAGKGADPAATTTGKKDPPKPPTGPRRAVKTFEDELLEEQALRRRIAESDKFVRDAWAAEDKASARMTA
jgi:hypothetical protein